MSTRKSLADSVASAPRRVTRSSSVCSDVSEVEVTTSGKRPSRVRSQASTTAKTGKSPVKSQPPVTAEIDLKTPRRTRTSSVSSVLSDVSEIYSESGRVTRRSTRLSGIKPESVETPPTVKSTRKRTTSNSSVSSQVDVADNALPVRSTRLSGIKPESVETPPTVKSTRKRTTSNSSVSSQVDVADTALPVTRRSVRLTPSKANEASAKKTTATPSIPKNRLLELSIHQDSPYQTIGTRRSKKLSLSFAEDNEDIVEEGNEEGSAVKVSTKDLDVIPFSSDEDDKEEEEETELPEPAEDVVKPTGDKRRKSILPANLHLNTIEEDEQEMDVKDSPLKNIASPKKGVTHTPQKTKVEEVGVPEEDMSPTVILDKYESKSPKKVDGKSPRKSDMSPTVNLDKNWDQSPKKVNGKSPRKSDISPTVNLDRIMVTESPKKVDGKSPRKSDISPTVNLGSMMVTESPKKVDGKSPRKSDISPTVTEDKTVAVEQSPLKKVDGKSPRKSDLSPTVNLDSMMVTESPKKVEGKSPRKSDISPTVNLDRMMVTESPKKVDGKSPSKIGMTPVSQGKKKLSSDGEKSPMKMAAQLDLPIKKRKSATNEFTIESVDIPSEEDNITDDLPVQVNTTPVVGATKRKSGKYLASTDSPVSKVKTPVTKVGPTRDAVDAMVVDISDDDEEEPLAPPSIEEVKKITKRKSSEAENQESPKKKKKGVEANEENEPTEDQEESEEMDTETEEQKNERRRMEYAKAILDAKRRALKRKQRKRRKEMLRKLGETSKTNAENGQKQDSKLDKTGKAPVVTNSSKGAARDKAEDVAKKTVEQKVKTESEILKEKQILERLIEKKRAKKEKWMKKLAQKRREKEMKKREQRQEEKKERRESQSVCVQVKVDKNKRKRMKNRKHKKKMLNQRNHDDKVNGEDEDDEEHDNEDIEGEQKVPKISLEDIVAKLDTMGQDKPSKMSALVDAHDALEESRGKAKSGRWWKETKEKFSTMVKTPGLRRPHVEKEKLRADIQKNKEMTRHILGEQAKAKEDHRLRRIENIRRREENAKKAEIVQVIKNPAKLKRMKKKQLRMIEKRDTLPLIEKRKQAAMET